jgi:hypothetical protein
MIIGIAIAIPATPIGAVGAGESGTPRDFALADPVYFNASVAREMQINGVYVNERAS